LASSRHTLTGERFIQQTPRPVWDQRDDEVEIHYVIVDGVGPTGRSRPLPATRSARAHLAT
jgi:hypothetical protein